jgi:hypothetical protein
MNRDKFIEYLRNPGRLDGDNADDIRGILDEYPYFQTAHLLLVKALNNLSDLKFSSQLKISAAHSGNRQILFDLIHQHKFTLSPPAVNGGILTDRSAGEKTESTTADDKSLPVTVPASAETTAVARAEEESATGTLAERVMKEIEQYKKAAGETSPAGPHGSAEPEFPDAATAVPATDAPSETAVPDYADAATAVSVTGAPSETTVPDYADAATAVPATDAPYETAVPDYPDAASETPSKTTGPEHPGPATADSATDALSETTRPDEVLFIDDSEDISAGTGPVTIDSAYGEPAKADPDLLELDKLHRSGEAGKQPAAMEHVTEKKNRDQVSGPSEAHSFSEWLDLFESETDTESKDPPDLIDRFLRDRPRIEPRSPLDDIDPPVDLSARQTNVAEEFFTETLARIYIQQKHYKKAIYAYEKLCLKYPEKYSYFADQIDEIKRFINQ